MEANIGIKPANLAAVAQSLGKILADEFVLYTKTRKAHWNVEGPDFHSKHLFFESQYGQLEQIIDDVAGKTLVSASSLSKDFSSTGTKGEQSVAVGKLIAEKAKAAGIEAVVFDRNGYLYHGRVKSLAEGAREAGLVF